MSFCRYYVLNKLGVSVSVRLWTVSHNYSVWNLQRVVHSVFLSWLCLLGRILTCRQLKLSQRAAVVWAEMHWPCRRDGSSLGRFSSAVPGSWIPLPRAVKVSFCTIQQCPVDKDPGKKVCMAWTTPCSSLPATESPSPICFRWLLLLISGSILHITFFSPKHIIYRIMFIAPAE